MKQMIEIDVPDGREVDKITEVCGTGVYILFKKKEPEFIEIRAYLVKTDYDGLVYCSVQKWWDTPELAAKHESFVKWLDQDWRKVEI